MSLRSAACLFTVLSLIFIGCSGQALAVEKSVADNQYTLGEVVVQATPASEESVGVVREITRLEIEAMNARTLDQVLKMIPGLYIRAGAEGVPRVDLRGFRSRHVVLLLNGIPFNSTYDGQFDPSLISTENIARIKIGYGTQSVLYGQGGLGGVINIITRAGGRTLGASLKGEVGQGDNYLGEVTAQAGNDKVNAFVSGSHNQYNNWRVSDSFDETSEQGGGARVGSRKKRSNAFADLQFSPNEDWLMGLSLGGLAGEYQKPPSTINDKKDQFANSPKYDAVEGILGGYGQAAVSYDNQGPLSFRAWGFINHLKENAKRYDDANYDSMSDSSVQTYDLDQKTDIYGGNLQTAYDCQAWGSLTLGLKAEQHRWSQSGRSRDQRIGSSKKYDWRNVDENKHLNIYTAALEYQVAPLPNLDITAGLSSNWQDKDNNDQSGLAYMIGARYGFETGTAVRGSYGHTIRFPSLRQLYEEDSGNEALDAEKADSFELAVEQNLPYNTLISLAGFYTEVKDYIEKDANNLNQNNDKYRFQGIELTVQSQPLKGLWLMASYTYMDTKDLSGGTPKDELQYRPKHKVALQGQYRFDFGLTAYAGLMYVADQVYYSKNSPLEKAKLGDYALVDVKVSQSFLNDMITVYLGADNVFDKNYETSYGYPSAGRFVYGGVGIRF